MKKKKILITGGHSSPAFSVLDELKTKGYENIIWVSEKHNQRGNKNVSAEYLTVTEKYKIKFINIKSGKLIRKWTRQTFIGGIKEFFDLIIGFFQSLYIIPKERPDIVISFGGFLAVPVVIVAKLFRRKVVTHEQTIVSGLANRIIGKFADKIFVSFEDSAKYFNPNKTIVSGNPMRKDILEVRSNITKALNPNLPIVYITGGNQGAHEINKRIFPILKDLLKIANVVHQTGNSTITNDFLKGNEIKSKLSQEGVNNYIVKEYVGPEEIGEVFDKSDIILGRSGANITLEILALGKLAVLIPIPWTYMDEQTKNAQVVVDTGLGKLLKQEDSLSSEDILNAIKLGFECKKYNVGFNQVNLEACVVEAKSKVKVNAAEVIVGEVERLIQA
jgi:UDP-N-acetylglucosamine--N-acetylmuramyl-(pentapeptide) pyrophosphoryl-undecaprenol N-acetylglucosamine transferase